jgi:hypothetical protein
MAGHHHHTPVSLDEQYIFQPATRTRALTAIGVGVVLVILGAILLASGVGEHHEGAGQGIGEQAHAAGEHAYHWSKRIYANLWLNSIFFTGIAVIGAFFVAVQYASQAGWSAGLLRIPMAFGYFLPITGVILLATFLVANHDLFHWTDHEVVDPNSPKYDAIIAGKHGFLNTPFFLIRMVLYFGVWFYMFLKLRNRSLREDVEGGLLNYDRNITTSVLFLIFFAVTSVTAAWDWVMSIDVHWFSTMFGWYMFASWWVTGLAVITLTVVNLKRAGYLQMVNANHLHDLGKFMFAFSIFWTYVWFSQFLLIYYANIPEEAVYFDERFEGYDGRYKIVFFLNVLINFVFPFLVLMTRDAKRHLIFLQIVCCAIIGGHWIDFYLMIMPGTVGENGGFGPVEFGMVAIFAGAFALVVGTFLAKAPLVAKNHPMLEESLHHNI